MNLNDINHVKKVTFWTNRNRKSDGDSIWVLTDLDFDFFHLMELRLKNVWAPETSTTQGKLVQDRIYAWLSSVPYLIIQTFKTKTDRDIKTLTRYVADVWLPDGTYFNKAIVDWMNDNGITDHGIGV